jgi:hypothetical protein
MNFDLISKSFTETLGKCMGRLKDKALVGLCIWFSARIQTLT